MDLVNIIITLMAIGAAACAIALAWPVREPKARDTPAGERDRNGATEHGPDGS